MVMIDSAAELFRVKRRLQLLFDCDSTAVRLARIRLQFEHGATIILRPYRPTCCGLQHCGRNN